jgi:hypothetical protein
VESSRIKDLIFYKPKPGIKKPLKRVESGLSNNLHLPDSLSDIQLAALAQAAPESVYVANMKTTAALNDDTDTASETEETVNPTVLGNYGDLYDPQMAIMSSETLDCKLSTLWSDYFLSNESLIDRNIIEQLTRNDEHLWYKLRVGRITATKAHSVMSKSKRANVNIDPTNAIKLIMGYHKIKATDYMKLGIEMEELARLKYTQMMTDGCGEQVDIDDDTGLDYIAKHVGFVCRKSGLQLHRKHHFLAATPDGVTFCECCGNGILEIKTLSKHFEDGIPNTVPNDICLNPELQLKITHPYYTQIQFQLLITDALFCDFVCVTKNEFYVQRILPDYDYICDLEKQCANFFKSYILKEIVSRSLDPVLR